MPQRSSPRSAPGPALAEGIYSLLIFTKFKLSLWGSMLFPTIATWVDLLFSKTLSFCPSNKRSRKGVAKGWLLAWNVLLSLLSVKKLEFWRLKFKKFSVSTTPTIDKESCESFVTLLAPLDITGALVYPCGDLRLAHVTPFAQVPRQPLRIASWSTASQEIYHNLNFHICLACHCHREHTCLFYGGRHPRS